MDNKINSVGDHFFHLLFFPDINIMMRVARVFFEASDGAANIAFFAKKCFPHIIVYPNDILPFREEKLACCAANQPARTSHEYSHLAQGNKEWIVFLWVSAKSL